MTEVLGARTRGFDCANSRTKKHFRMMKLDANLGERAREVFGSALI